MAEEVGVEDAGRERDLNHRSEEACTHRVDDALKSLEAIIHLKHMVLTVCYPCQLRTDTNTCREVSGMEDMEDYGELLCGAWGRDIKPMF